MIHILGRSYVLLITESASKMTNATSTDSYVFMRKHDDEL